LGDTDSGVESGVRLIRNEPIFETVSVSLIFRNRRDPSPQPVVVRSAQIRFTSASMTGLRASLVLGCVWVITLSMVPADAKNFRYGDIFWKACRNSEAKYQAFYDPLFPDVCKSCESPLCLGITVNVVFSRIGVTGSMFLENLEVDVAKYLASGRTEKELRLPRNMPSGNDMETSELRIGYRDGLGDQTTEPAAASGNSRGGIIHCSIPPCPDPSTGLVDDYVFMIDRLSDDETTVFARYSFQMQFSKNGDYTVYFDGCCRPGTLMNNAGLVFQVRTGIQLYVAGMNGGAAREYLKSSVRFSMPPVVHLRMNGNAYESPQCQPVCGQPGEQGACMLRFQVQAAHEELKYHSQIRYRLGSVNEMGHYRCQKHTGLCLSCWCFAASSVCCGSLSVSSCALSFLWRACACMSRYTYSVCEINKGS
jgi:hypothetical protein